MSKQRRRIITLIVTETWTITWTGLSPPTESATSVHAIIAPPTHAEQYRQVKWQAVIQWCIKEMISDE